MPNYNFHNLLNDYEFQNFGANLVEIREGIKIFCNTKTHDGGKDFYSADNKIMGQVKCHQNNFEQLKKSLKDDVEKAKRVKPERYILVTSVECSDKKKLQLVEMFEGYLKLEDILDRIEINKLLQDKKYNDLQESYLNLIAPNTYVLKSILDKIVNKSIYNITALELENIKDDKEIFVLNDNYYKMLNMLLKNRALIISGEVGVGKTTLGRMLSLRLLNNDKNTQFISVDNIEDLFNIYDPNKSQILFFDDFLGDTTLDFDISSKHKKRLLELITDINKSNNKWLIMTTREYVFNDGINDEITNSKYSKYKINLELKNISRLEKFKILKKHIQKFNLSYEHTKTIFENLELIIDNDNYNPRFLKTFFEQYDKTLENEIFLEQLINNLDEPFEYWSTILKEQPFEVKVMLMLLAFEGKMTVTNLQSKLFNIIKNRNLDSIYLNVSINDSIKKMDNTFTITKKNEDGKIKINFKNPSYKDFLIYYFDKHFMEFGEIIFSEINNIDGLINILKILNNNYDQSLDNYLNILSEKIILKLEQLNNKFDHIYNLVLSMDFSNNKKLCEYVLNYIKYMEDNFHDEIIFSPHNNYFIFPQFVYNLNKKINLKEYIDVNYIIDEYLTYITDYKYSIECFNRWLELKKSFKEEFLEYVEYNREFIKSILYSACISSAFDCINDNNINWLEEVIYEDVEKVYKKVNIKYPVKLQRDLEEIYNKHSKKITRTTNNDYQPKKIDETKEIEKIKEEINDFLGVDDIIPYYKFDDYLKSLKLKKNIEKVINDIKNYKYEQLNFLIYNKSSLQILIDYLENNKLYNDILFNINNIIEYIIKIDDVNINDQINILRLSNYLLMNDMYKFNPDELKQFMDKYSLVENDIIKILDTKLFIKEGNWYKFSNVLFLIHFSMKYYTFCSDIVNFHDIFIGICCVIPDYIYNDIFRKTDIFKLINIYNQYAWEEYIIKKEFESFLTNIDTKNKFTIAKSMLKQFNFRYYYSATTLCSGKYDNALIYDFIYMYFDIIMGDLFDLTFDDNSLQHFIYRFVDNDEVFVLNDYLDNDEVFVLNDYLDNKKFIKVLNENGIIDLLNNLYHDIKNKIDNILTINT